MRIMDRVRDVGIRRRLAAVTIECYQGWIEQFLRFCKVDGNWREPGALGAREVESFLTHLARDRRLSASSQNQANCTIAPPDRAPLRVAKRCARRSYFAHRAPEQNQKFCRRF